MSNVEKIELLSSQVELSEVKSDPDILKAKFIISGFGINKNKVQINRDTIDEWVGTLVGKPLVGKVSTKLDGTMDFEGHNLKVVTKYNSDGTPYKEAEFDTNGFGCFTSAEIEEIDGVEYITATANIWKRFKNAVSVIKDRVANGSLQTSWEISIDDSTSKIVNGTVVKIINAGRFIGHCLLGSNIEPAYDESGLLQVASKDTSQDLSNALSQDCLDESLNINMANSTDKEVNMAKENEIIENSAENEITSEINAETKESENQETSADSIENENAENKDDETDDELDEDKDKDTENSEEEKEDDDDETENDDEDDDKEESAKDDDKDKDKECSSETEVSALTDIDLRNKISVAYEKFADKWGYIFMLFPTESIAWIEPYGREKETHYIEVKYTVENDEVTITEANDVELVVSPRNINEQIASKDSAIAEMSTQIANLNKEVAELKPYKEKIDEIEKAEKEAQLEKDRQELSEYAISSGYITKDEIENSEEIKVMISELDKTGIKALISDRVVASLKAGVETSAQNNSKETNVKVNLSAVETSSKDNSKVSAKDAQSAIRKYLGRK